MKLLLTFILIFHAASAWEGSAHHSASDGESISIDRSSQNGNTVTKTRRMLSNGDEKVVVTVSSPSVTIDGDECELNFKGFFFEILMNFTQVSCAGVKCPKETFKCHVTSETIASDHKKMKNIIECQDKDGKVLKKEEGTEANPHPEDQPPFSRVATISRDGTISVEDSRNNVMHIGGNTKMTKEQEAELNRNMRRMNQDFANRMGDFERNMEASMSHMQENMNQAFGNNFPFGNSNPFGNNFPFGNNANPFGNHPFGNNYDPFANFRTFFYSPTPSINYPTQPINYPTPPINYDNTNFNGVVTGYVNYPTPSPYVPITNNYDYDAPKESEFSVEEFKPIYHHPSDNHQTSPPVNNFYGKYRYAYK